MFNLAEKVAEPTKWADVKDAEEAGDFIDEMEDDEEMDIVR